MIFDVGVLPPGFQLASLPIGRADDRHTVGREAARRALAALGEDPSALAYEGTRPIVCQPRASRHVAVSITHSRTTALAIAGRVERLGVDLCADDPRLPALAERFLVDELGGAPHGDLGALFAAKEAALKALGLGLVDGGVLDGTAVRVVSLDPPKLSDPTLTLALGRLRGEAVAVVYG